MIQEYVGDVDKEREKVNGEVRKNEGFINEK